MAVMYFRRDELADTQLQETECCAGPSDAAAEELGITIITEGEQRRQEVARAAPTVRLSGD